MKRLFSILRLLRIEVFYMEISEIIERANIVDYISQYCTLKEQNGELWGLSPLKDENTPSFSVNEKKQIFYDFSSGTGGNIITFIQKYHKCSFIQALNILKEYIGIDKDNEINFNNNHLTSAKIAKKFKKQTDNKKKAKYSILPEDCMEKYEFDKDKLSIWTDEGITEEELTKYDVMYDSLSNRIVFPLRSMSGEIINIVGRTLDDDYKNKKTPKYIYFKPLGILDTLYGFFENQISIVEKNEIIIFEGSKSVMKADTFGVKNSVAILTSHLNPYQMLLLVKLGARVVFALDEDINILEDENINRLKKYVKVEVVKNMDGILESKMSPVDAGKENWDYLYLHRQAIN